MLLPPYHNSLVLTGPTGSGKTKLALDWAEHLNAEIIAMDSMTLFRGMDIGTAKPSAAERSQVPHHLLDVLDPWESASVAWWLEQAVRCCREIEGRGKQALFVGGTPLYLKGLMFGLFDGPPADAQVRQRLTEQADKEGAASLHQRLHQVDPETAGRLHPNDVRRVIRALEVQELTGQPISAWQVQWKESGVRSQWAVGSGQWPGIRDQGTGVGNVDGPQVLWLNLPRDELYARINRRVEEMFAAGLVEEVRRLQAHPRGLSQEARQALGYKETLDFLAGTATLADTIALVQTRTRNLAKRQITWFRHLPGCVPFTSELTQTPWQPKIKG